MLFMSIETMQIHTYVVFTVYYGLIDLQSQLSIDPLKRRSALSQIDVGLDFFYIFTFEHYVCMYFISMYCISVIVST